MSYIKEKNNIKPMKLKSLFKLLILYNNFLNIKTN